MSRDFLMLHRAQTRDRIPGEVKTGVPLFFIGAFLALTILFAGIQALIVLGSAFDSVHGAPDLVTGIVTLGSSAAATLLISAIIAAVLVMFRLLRSTRRPTVSLLVLFVLLAAAMYGGSVGSGYLAGRFAVEDSPVRYIPAAGSFLISGDEVLYVDERFGDYELRRVLLYRPITGEESTRFHLYRRAIFQPDHAAVEFPGGEPGFPVAEATNAPWRMFEPPPPVAALSRDLTQLAEIISTSVTADLLGGSAVIIALSFVVVMTWVFVRMSRWPLLNAMLVIGWIRFLLAMVAIPANPRFGELMERLLGTPEAMREFLFPAVLMLVGVLLLIVNLILPPFDHWRREVHGV